ncbi:MAG: hypothetical protein AAF434_20445 [Pseudomonadota bacterium]
MRPRRRPSGFSKQRGVSLIAAIFVIVTLSTLGALIASISVLQHNGAALSMQSARALAAASAGVEWGIWFVRTNDHCETNPANSSFTVGQFTVSQTLCDDISVTEGVTTYTVYELEFTASSTGLSFGDPGYASRTLYATVIDL